MTSPCVIKSLMKLYIQFWTNQFLLFFNTCYQFRETSNNNNIFLGYFTKQHHDLLEYVHDEIFTGNRNTEADDLLKLCSSNQFIKCNF